LTKSGSDQDASNDLPNESPSTDSAGEDSKNASSSTAGLALAAGDRYASQASDGKRFASPWVKGAANGSTEETNNQSSQPAQIANMSAPLVGWIRRHRGISVAVAAVLVLCIVGSIFGAVSGTPSATSDNSSSLIQPGANGGPPTVEGLRPDQQAYVCSIAHNSTLNVGYDPTAVYNWVHAFPNPNTNGITYDQVVAALQTC
jgi:hypothetical protein